jgi:hypothetical protein
VIDGFNNRNPRDGTAAARPNLDAMQEFKTETSGYSAEAGRTAGGLITMVIKSGTNQLHGTLFEFLRNDKMDARNFFATTKPELRRNEFGGLLNGPVVIPKLYNGRNHTFFLFSSESQRQVQGSPTLGVVPTAAVRAGDFSAYAPLQDPLSPGTFFPGNQIPQSRMSGIALKIQPYFPLPNYPGLNNCIYLPRLNSCRIRSLQTSGLYAWSRKFLRGLLRLQCASAGSPRSPKCDIRDMASHPPFSGQEERRFCDLVIES